VAKEAAVQTAPTSRIDPPDDAAAEIPVARGSVHHEVPWRWIGVGALAGLALCGFAALDVSLVANFLAALVAFAAHGALGLLLVDPYYEYVRSPRPSMLRGLAYAAVWVIAVAVLGILLVKLDMYIANSSMTNGDQVAYFVAMGLALIGAGLGAVLVYSKTRWKGRPERFGWKAIGGVGGVVAGAVAVVLVIGALAADRQTDRADERPVVPAIHGIDGRYVALGDSYSAGEGLTPFLGGTASGEGGDGCHRSGSAYPMLLDLGSDHGTPEFRACSGAVSSDMYTDFHRSADLTIDAQIPGTPQREVGLVTITVGGNDVVFSRVVAACLLHEDCLDAPFVPPEADGRRPEIVHPPTAPLRDWAHQALGRLSERMTKVTSALDASYPTARIVMIGYPYLFPDGPAPWLQADCAVVLRRVSQSEREELRDLTDELNNFLYAHAVAAGFEFVSPAAAWDGHEPCGSEGQYTNAVKPLLRLANFVDGGSFHPNARGQQQLARLVSCYLNENPVAPAPFSGGEVRPISVTGTVDLDELGLAQPPGSLDSPVHCGSGEAV